MNNPLNWKTVTFQEIEKVDKRKIVIIPVGSIEAHGKHLPLTTDSIIPYWFCKRISQKYPCIIGPPINFGLSGSLLSFSGTISVRKKTFSFLLEDILNSILVHGFKKIYFLNGHGGNDEILAKIVNKFNKKLVQPRLKYKNWYSFDFLEKLKKNNKTYKGDHADRLETEMMLAVCEELVDKKLIKDHLPKWPPEKIYDYRKVMTHGVYGFPSKANKKAGQKLFQKITNALVRDIKKFDEQKI